MKATDKREVLRLKILDEYQILDTLPEAMYDDISQIASTLCNLPISFITLIDNQRQFFISRHGFDVSETPIEEAICYHAILEEADFFEVEDLRNDLRFSSYSLVTKAPNLISYYGVLLRNEEGVPFGTLCVASNNEVAILNENQKDALKKLSRQVVYLLELRKKNFVLKSYQSEVESYAVEMEDFAYTAAHDLRSPLRSVTSFLKLVASNREEEWTEKELLYFKFIFENVTRMDSLIVALLNFAKSNKELDDVELIDLDVFVPELFKTLSKSEATVLPILIKNTFPVIEKSKLAISLIFNNLIENALKYKKAEVVSEIKIHYTSSGTNHVFEISDNGIGIEAEYLDIIFKPFRRLHTQSEFTGTGLGLATVKKNIANLNGTISVTSTKGVGTTFTISIPK